MAISGIITELIAILDKRNKTPHTNIVINDNEKETIVRL